MNVMVQEILNTFTRQSTRLKRLENIFYAVLISPETIIVSLITLQTKLYNLTPLPFLKLFKNKVFFLLQFCCQTYPMSYIMLLGNKNKVFCCNWLKIYDLITIYNLHYLFRSLPNFLVYFLNLSIFYRCFMGIGTITRSGGLYQIYETNRKESPFSFQQQRKI